MSQGFCQQHEGSIGKIHRQIFILVHEDRYARQFRFTKRENLE